MFDVPVLEVTVSSAHTIINSASSSNPVARSNPQVPLALLKALAELPQSVRINSATAVESPASTVAPSPSQTLFSQTPFQLLEPLNFATAAESLGTVFSLPLELDTPSNREEVSPLPVISAPVELAASVSTAAPADSSNQTSTAHLKSAAADLTKATPTKPNQNLSHCLDTPSHSSQNSTTFQVVRQGVVIGEVNDLNSTAQAISALQGMLEPEELIPHEITPVLGNGQPVIRLSRDVLLQTMVQPGQTVAEEQQPELSREWAVITWSDQLRQTLGATALDAGDVQVMLKGFQPSDQKLNGLASWYGPYFHGRLTANGETFDQNTLTAAHKTLPFDTVLQVRNLKNNRSIVVRINDRGPYIGKRTLDLSKAAAQCLDSETSGVIPYEAVILEQPLKAESEN